MASKTEVEFESYGDGENVKHIYHKDNRWLNDNVIVDVVLDERAVESINVNCHDVYFNNIQDLDDYIDMLKRAKTYIKKKKSHGKSYSNDIDTSSWDNYEPFSDGGF